MLSIINVSPVKQSSLRAERNEMINASIATSFEQSKRHFGGFKLFESEIGSVVPKTLPTGELPKQFLKEGVSGHAVSCFVQGISQRFQKNFTKAECLEICNKVSCYFEKESSVPLLFDHYGLRRATDIMEIVEAIQRGSIATCIMSENFGHRYVNAIYLQILEVKTQGIVLVDPYQGGLSLTFSDFLKAVEGAWIW